MLQDHLYHAYLQRVTTRARHLERGMPYHPLLYRRRYVVSDTMRRMLSMIVMAKHQSVGARNIIRLYLVVPMVLMKVNYHKHLGVLGWSLSMNP